MWLALHARGISACCLNIITGIISVSLKRHFVFALLIKCWDWTFSKSKDLIFPNTSDNYIISCFQDAMMCEGILGKILPLGISFSSSLYFTTATATACSKFETSVSSFHFLFLISLPSRPGLVPWWKTGYKCKYGRAECINIIIIAINIIAIMGREGMQVWLGSRQKPMRSLGWCRWVICLILPAGLFPSPYFRGVAFMVQRKGGKSGKSAPGNW